ncbi:hypothetical protein HZC31_07050 [Candidatus Woesearchaeota archaeon]|nr:hypothetical protein [Candidatus Woesearchaeota archaeon]
MPNDRYYISFREFLMDRNNQPVFFQPVLFEVLKENNETVTVRLLEDHQLILEERLEAERLELEAKIKGFPKAGQEYIIRAYPIRLTSM